MTTKNTCQVVQKYLLEIWKEAYGSLTAYHLVDLASKRVVKDMDYGIQINKLPDIYGLRQEENEPLEKYITRFANRCRCNSCTWFLWVESQLVFYAELEKQLEE